MEVAFQSLSGISAFKLKEDQSWSRCVFVESVGEKGIVMCRYLHLAKEDKHGFTQLNDLWICLADLNCRRSYSNFI